LTAPGFLIRPQGHGLYGGRLPWRAGRYEHGMSLEWGIVRNDPAAFEVRAPDPSERPDLTEAPVRPSRLSGILLPIAAIPVCLSALYTVVPPASTLMLARLATFRPVERDWVPLDEISPALPRAVIASEDGGFCRHWGVDWGAVREVIEE